MKFGITALILIASSTSQASLDECVKKCTDNSPGFSEECLMLTIKNRRAVKTIVDIINLFKSQKLPNADSNFCPRHSIKVDNNFTSTGDRCTEWSTHYDDHSVGNHLSVELPQDLSGQYNNGVLRFSSQTPKPVISFHSNGSVVTEWQGRVLSATDVKWGNYTMLILETDSICHSVDLDY